MEEGEIPEWKKQPSSMYVYSSSSRFVIIFQ